MSNAGRFEEDLVILAADKDIESAMDGLLSRTFALGIHPLTTKLFRHPERDPGCYLRSHEFLRAAAPCFAHALVIFDRQGCGRDVKPRSQLEKEVENNLSRNGWDNRAAAIVLDPHLEVWVWSDSPEVDMCLGWHRSTPQLRQWLEDQGIWPASVMKPPDPKGAFESALRYVRKPRSSSIFAQLAKRVSVQRCSDLAFVKLKELLRAWFPQTP
jgi:hypothetical protein